MEQLESLQRVNRQQRLAEWGRRVEACRNSGLTVAKLLSHIITVAAVLLIEPFYIFEDPPTMRSKVP